MVGEQPPCSYQEVRPRRTDRRFGAYLTKRQGVDRQHRVYTRSREDLKQLAREVEDLTAKVPTGKSTETYLCAILLAADHAAYHVGQRRRRPPCAGCLEIGWSLSLRRQVTGERFDRF